MDKAVISGCYVDLKFMPGLKVSRVSIDIPIEYSNEFLKMFDAPDRANPVHVAIARLGTPVAEPLPEGAPAPTTPDKRKPGRSEIAAMKLKDQNFNDWLYLNYGDPRDHSADQILKRTIGVNSKSELDTPGPAQEAWDKLITDFEVRAYAR